MYPGGPSSARAAAPRCALPMPPDPAPASAKPRPASGAAAPTHRGPSSARAAAPRSAPGLGKASAGFTPDAAYHNIPVEPVTGHDGIRELLNMFAPAADAAEFEIVNIASRGSLVFTERIDRFTMNGRQVSLPVAGVFEIRDGQIAAWRDYFDFATWQRQVA